MITGNLLHKFQAISLNDSAKASLQNRKVDKYLANKETAEKLIAKLNDYYILEINNIRSFIYQTTYYDTPENSMYYDHHNGKATRYKVRVRNYKNTNTSFLEIKKRTPNKQTNKSRIEIIPGLNDKTPEQKDFILNNTPYSFDYLIEKSKSEFNRITLVSVNFTDRITVDYNLLLTGATNKIINLENTVIIEHKTNKTKSQQQQKKVFRQLGLQKTSFSKYCMVRALTEPALKQNRFKPQRIKVNKIENGFNHQYAY